MLLTIIHVQDDWYIACYSSLPLQGPQERGQVTGPQCKALQDGYMEANHSVTDDIVIRVMGHAVAKVGIYYIFT